MHQSVLPRLLHCYTRNYGAIRQTVYALLWTLGTLAALALLPACSSSPDKPTPTDDPVYTLIFLDKTRSVDVNKAFVGQKYQEAVNEIIEQNIRQKGDKLDVYFIHENTSKARALNVTVRSEMEDVSAASQTDREAAETEFNLLLTREKAQIRQRVLQQLVAQNTGSSNRETDIWASLPVIAKANESGATVKVYYLSDMIESVKGTGRRDFQVTPPKDNAQADAWAKADAEQLKRHTIGTPDITMILPFEPNASVRENNPAVTQYWQTLFAELGAGVVEEQ
ncbi:hypothetical protein [Spirosoma fluviale]|uniref:VWFA domain-containing protein n=1 Tax=Spirosoma fluviale TaxID=1597977 RepID=A0A286GMY5_9BACT|nr:hypothetical protein [Spirosoma fluviale]SOD96870.1 hypothetical protein SAMN06269250_5540 [Spirosoma fluviale]